MFLAEVDKFDNYSSFISDATDKLIDTYKEYKRLKNNYFESGIMSDKESSMIGDIVSTLLYLTNDTQLNKFIEELKNILISSNKEFNYSWEARRYLGDTDINQAYRRIFKYSNKFINEDRNEYQDEILSIVNKYSGKDFKTYREFKNSLFNKTFRFQKELGYTISEICSEYLGENRDFVFWYPDINEILESLKDFNLDE